MPTYEYECLKCGTNFDRFQSMTARPVRECPSCKGKVRRLIGAGGGVIFKGSGFYATDYKRARTKPCAASKDCPSRACPMSKGDAPSAKPSPTDPKRHA